MGRRWAANQGTAAECTILSDEQCTEKYLQKSGDSRCSLKEKESEPETTTGMLLGLQYVNDTFLT